MVKIEKEKTEEIKAETPEIKTKKLDFSKLRENPWMVSTFVFAALAVILFVVFFTGRLTGNVVSESDIGVKAVDFVNNEILQGSSTVTLDSISEEAGLYKVTVNYNGQKIPTYFTRNGEYYVGTNVVATTGNASDSSTEETPVEIPKTSKPTADLYVMSFCPYGNKAEDTMIPVYNLLKNKVEFNVHYIVGVSGSSVQSLHGQPEVDENEREACVMKEYGKDKFWSFMTAVNTNCGSDGSCWESQAQKLGIDTNKIKNCVSSSGLSLMQAEAAASDAAGASGSPTLIINGVESTSVYKYGDSETYKEAICSAFNTEPSECSQTLESSTSTSTSSGSCG